MILLHLLANAAAALPLDKYPHPILGHPARWPGVMLIVIGAMFLAASVIGPIVRANLREQPPVADAHGH